MQRIWRWGAAAGLVITAGLVVTVGACSGGSNERPTTTDDSATTGESTGQVTTFDPTTTTVDPSTTEATVDPDASGSADSGSADSGSGETTGGTSTGATTGGEAPTVQSTSPDDLASGVAAGTSVEITFSEVMDPGTITTNTADEGCTGSVQVSSDGFGTCVRMAAAPSSGDDQTFVVTPMAALASTGLYQIRVLAEVTDAGGTPMAADFTTGTGFTVQYFHTIAIDGVDDFTADETFTTSTAGNTGYIAWDDTYLYLGMDSPNLAANSNQEWLVAYFGGPMGSTAGVTYNTQQPQLPFSARWHARWRASDDYGGALEWNGMAWNDPGFGPTPGSGDVAYSGSFVELRIAWADLGDPAYLDLHMGMLREEPLNEWTWAGVPAGSYTDGYEPDVGQLFQFDLAGSTAPANYAPM